MKKIIATISLIVLYFSQISFAFAEANIEADSKTNQNNSNNINLKYDEVTFLS